MLWAVSVCAVTVSNFFTDAPDPLTLVAAAVGVTSLVFAAKGNFWAQVLMIVFSILYGVISYRFRYYGEMVTYLGMTLPMAVLAAITWLRHPSGREGAVTVGRMNAKRRLLLGALTAAVTVGFYFILGALDTPNLWISTLSVTTSFAAAALTALRVPSYALFYAANDCVLVTLWVLASFEDAGYIPVAVNFAIFLVNDLYGYVSWLRRARAGAGEGE